MDASDARSEGRSRAGEPGARPERVRPADLAIALAILAALATAYLARAQERIYGHDGVFLVQRYNGAAPPGARANSALHAPLADWARSITASEHPTRVLEVLSAVPAALGVACAFLVARALGAGREAAGFGCALLALAPVQMLFATVIEIHALHLAAVGIAACVTVFAPWRRPLLALAAVCAALPLLPSTHLTAALLGPGWVLLVQASRARVAAPFRARTLLLGVGPALLAALALGYLGTNWIWSRTLSIVPQAPPRFGDLLDEPFPIEMLWGGFALPLFLLAPVAVAGALARAGPRLPQLACATLAGVPALALLWQGIPERGAYFLGCAPFLAALASLAGASATLPAPRVLAAALIGIQAVAGIGETAAWGATRSVVERARIAAKVLPEGGGLLSMIDDAPDVGLFVEGTGEVELELEVRRAFLLREPADDFAERIGDLVESALASGEGVALDLSHRRLYEHPPSVALLGALEPYAIALETLFQRRFRATYRGHPDWPMWRLRARPAGGDD